MQYKTLALASLSLFGAASAQQVGTQQVRLSRHHLVLRLLIFSFLGFPGQRVWGNVQRTNSF